MQVSAREMGHAGLSQEQQSRLLRSARDFAASRVSLGKPTSEDEPAARSWVEQTVAFVYPKPTNLPPEPRINDNGWRITLLPFALFGGLVLGAMNGNGKGLGGFGGTLALVWGAYIVLWLIGSASTRASERANAEYWQRYDPNRKFRRYLEDGLASVASSELRTARWEYSRPLAEVPVQKIDERPRQQLPWTPVGPHPTSLASCTDRRAEFLAKEWMEYLGATGCRVSQGTRDGGADVFRDHFVAEVKHHASPVGPALIRQIFGVAHAERRQALFFTLTGYTEESVRFANSNGIALFVYNPSAGTLRGRSVAGEKAVERGLLSLLVAR